ncbi:phospholipid-transporting ATPase [Trichonephila clavipes]|nr:phospholipid-transporting ATPase [Trichonephila clavipes]
MKAGSVLVAVMAVCWSEGDQRNASNKTVCGLDTLDQHLESWSGEPFLMSTLVVIPNTLTANLYISLVIKPIVLPFMNCIQGGAFQQDNADPPTAVVTQRVLQVILTRDITRSVSN